MDREKTMAAVEAAMDEAFKFKVGDVASFKTMVAAVNIESEAVGGKLPYGRMPTAGPLVVVLEQHAVRCHGGTQRMYLVQGVNGETGAVSQPTRVSEDSLASTDELRAVIATWKRDES